LPTANNKLATSQATEAIAIACQATCFVYSNGLHLPQTTEFNSLTLRPIISGGTVVAFTGWPDYFGGEIIDSEARSRFAALCHMVLRSSVNEKPSSPAARRTETPPGDTDGTWGRLVQQRSQSFLSTRRMSQKVHFGGQVDARISICAATN